MDEILVIGRADEEISRIRTLLSQEFSEHKIRFSKPDKDSITRHLSKKTQLAIMNYRKLPEHVDQSTKAVRTMGYNESIMLLAEDAPLAQVHQIEKQEGVSFLPKPYSNKDIKKFTAKILRHEPVFQRKHARYDVKETVSFEAFGVSGMIAAEMTRMSKGGAQLKIVGHHKLTYGDLIQLHIQLRNLDRYHRMPAQVVYCEYGDVAMSGDTFSVRWLPEIVQKKIA